MQVLTTVDADRIRALRERDEYFWLDLARPAPEALEEVGRLLHIHPLALEDSREFSQRPKLYRYPDAVLFVYWSGRIVDDGTGSSRSRSTCTSRAAGW
jgi:magnesium transporter